MLATKGHQVLGVDVNQKAVETASMLAAVVVMRRL